MPQILLAHQDVFLVTRSIVFAEIKKRLAIEGGKLHALVNNAGISPKGPKGGRLGAASTSFNDWHHVFQVNFFAPIMLARGLLDPLHPGLARKGGFDLLATMAVHH